MTNTPITAENSVQQSIEDSCSMIIAKSAAKVTALSALPIPLIEVGSQFFIQMDMIKKMAKKFHIKIEGSNVPLVSAVAATLVSKFLSELTQNLTESLKLNSLLSDTLIKSTMAGFTTTLMGEIYFHHFYHGGTVDNMDLKTYTNYIVDQLNSDRLNLGNITHHLVDQVVEKIGFND
jgi:uncharacterized protein (DUF697 family)